MVLGLLSIPHTGLMASSTPALTPNQTAAVMGIITNFILDDDVETLYHNGTAYGTVTSPYTGRVWLDRNLGATQVCTAFDDTNCYGDYYQWGRNADGHENSLSKITDLQAIDVTMVGHGDFIAYSQPYRYDWAIEADPAGWVRAANWSETDASSVCPIGFRVPTVEELKAELLDMGSAQINDNGIPQENAFTSFLKLPSSGYRNFYTGSMRVVGLIGFLWSSSTGYTTSAFINFAANISQVHMISGRTTGIPIR